MSRDEFKFLSPEEPSLTDAEWQIQRFVLRFQPQYRQREWKYRPQPPAEPRFQPEYLLLAQYASLPLVLTPELLNYLRTYFLPQVPWIAEADLLLSDLCRAVGYEQYVLLPEVRSVLLDELEQQHPTVLPAVARKIINYSRYLARTNPYITHREQRRQEWSAMGFIVEERQNLADQVAEAFAQVGMELGSSEMGVLARREMEHLARLVKEMSANLQDYPRLLAYAELVTRALKEPEAIDRQVLRQSFTHGDRVLPKLENLLPSPLFPDLNTFEFDVVEFVDTANLSLEPFNFEVATLTVSQLEVEDVVEIANEAIKSRTGKELTALQLEIIEGIWKKLSYAEIAEAKGFTIGSVRTVKAELFRSLSAELRISISKKNMVEVFGRLAGKPTQPAVEVRRVPGRAYHLVEPLSAEVGLEMVKIPAGEFMMGAPEEEAESDSERPQHRVKVPEFYLGKYPVTQAQWRFGANLPQIDRQLDPDPSDFKGDNLPVEQVSWLDAIEFCARLSVHTGREYRLPTESEWEYACRAGTSTPFHFGETIDPQIANYNGNYTYGRGQKGTYRGKTTPVGSFKVANNFGLYDMHGNVWEWCQDHWHKNYQGAPTDGSAWLNQSNDRRVMRGGSWSNNPRNCRSATRNGLTPVVRDDYSGFRIVCEIPRTL